MLKNKLFHFFVFLAFLLWGFIIYSNTLKGPFLYDDISSIVENPVIKIFDLKSIWNYKPSRFLTYLTFALNYKTSGLNPTVFHIINILIHVLSAYLVYRIIFLYGKSVKSVLTKT